MKAACFAGSLLRYIMIISDDNSDGSRRRDYFDRTKFFLDFLLGHIRFLYI